MRVSARIGNHPGEMINLSIGRSGGLVQRGGLIWSANQMKYAGHLFQSQCDSIFSLKRHLIECLFGY
jgi:hypothetical protein